MQSDCTQGVYGHPKRVCTESWLWDKNPLLHRGLEPASAACWSNALPTVLHPRPYNDKWRGRKSTRANVKKGTACWVLQRKLYQSDTIKNQRHSLFDGFDAGVGVRLEKEWNLCELWHVFLKPNKRNFHFLPDPWQNKSLEQQPYRTLHTKQTITVTVFVEAVSKVKNAFKKKFFQGEEEFSLGHFVFKGKG